MTRKRRELIGEDQRAGHMIRGLLFLILATTPAVGAGTKNGAGGSISDDLLGGSAGSVGLTSAAGELSGSLGQVATELISSGSNATESGYFSRMVSSPTGVGFPTVDRTSFTIQFGDSGNAAGTDYLVQLSTDDFSTLALSLSTGSSPATATGLSQGTTYSVRIRAEYMESDRSAFSLSVSTLVGERENPTGAVTAPAGAFAKTLATIAGTAWDASGVSLAELQISSNAVGAGDTSCWGGAPHASCRYWDGSAWVDAASYVAANLAGSAPSYTWSYTLPGGIDLKNGQWYTAALRLKDVPNNQILAATRTFTLDTVAPEAAVTFPVNGGFAGAGSVILQGTATEANCTQGGCPGPDAGLDVSSVTVALQSLIGPTTWWSGSDWVETSEPIWSTATFVGESSGTWTYTLSPGVLTDAVTYKVTARARDRANNQQLVNLTTNTFTAEFSAPSSVVVTPANGSSYWSLSQVQGTAADSGVSGIDRVYVAYYVATGGSQAWWNKNTQSFDLPDAPVPPDPPGPASSYWVEASTDNGNPVNWSATGAFVPTWNVGDTYHVLSAAVDRALNVESRPSSPAAGTSRSGYSFITQPPVSAITKPDATTPHFRFVDATLAGTANEQATSVDVRVKDVSIPAKIRYLSGRHPDTS